MHEDVKTSLRHSLKRCLTIIKQAGPRCMEPFLTYTLDETNPGGIHGSYAPVPSLGTIFRVAEHYIKDAGSGFAQSFEANYPEHCKPFICSIHPFTLQPQLIPGILAAEVWRECGSDDVAEPGSLEREIDGFASFIDASSIRVHFSAPLINYSGPSMLSLAENLAIRRLSSREFTESFGGNIIDISMTHSAGRKAALYVLEGHYDEPKQWGAQTEPINLQQSPAASRLRMALLALRTFKAGRVGYQYIDFRTKPYATPNISIGHGELATPLGSYTLSESDVPALLAHMSLFLTRIKTSSSLEMACSRLADAETRNRPEDCIVDAVIAMEALLLASEEGHSDLALKFCLNYALTCDVSIRMHAYEEARTLYNIRSTIAHGSRVEPRILKVKGEQPMTLQQTAERATRVARHVLHYFLKFPEASYEAKDFWRRRYLSVP